MWANAQRDGRPAKYRWRPLFNAAVCLTPTTRLVTGQLADTPTRELPTRGLDISRTGQLAD